MGLFSRALDIQRRDGKIAIHSDFAEFIIAEAEEANSAFYKAIFATDLPRRKNNSTKRKLKAFNPVAAKRANEVSKGTDKPTSTFILACPCCDRSHE